MTLAEAKAFYPDLIIKTYENLARSTMHYVWELDNCKELICETWYDSEGEAIKGLVETTAIFDSHSSLIH